MAIAREDFAYVVDLLHKNAAIVLDANKQYLVEARLTRLAREVEIEDLSSMLARARRPDGLALRTRIIDAMTTNETSFFRDGRPFACLKEPVVPTFMKARAAEKRLHIWCAGCSSGQEPYSIAMVLHTHFRLLGTWDFRIIASDISERVLAMAAAGKYTEIEVNRGLPADMRARYFTHNGAAWTVKDELRNMIEFKKINLIHPFGALPQFDIIFIRNVFIYFDRETKQQILSRIVRLLRPDGLLFLGETETLMNVTDRFERVPALQSSIYQLRAPT